MITTLRNLNIFQIGVGGTGSWLVAPVSKFIANINARFRDLHCVYTLVDNDTVEDRNILRQNFKNEDIGRHKATVLGRANFQTFQNIRILDLRLKTSTDIKRMLTDNLNVNLQRDEFENINMDYTNSLNIFFGCVDNNMSRLTLYNYLKNKFEYPAIYFDSGNNLHSGQIITTWFNLPEDMNINGKDVKQINFRKLFPKNPEDETTQTCAFFGDQSQSINMLASTMIFTNLQTLIINNQIPPIQKTFNSSGRATFSI